ncbi:Deoxyribose-phosphate aldolase [Blattella germanica]|nr:Deoxyribose-phosphate aldolase [Blattella germanica]
MSERNPGCELDIGWLNEVHINLPAIKQRAASLQSRRSVKQEWQAAWLLRAITCIDLTTLSGDDTPCNVFRLCAKAAHPLSSDILSGLGFLGKDDITTAAVCVYPARVADAVSCLNKMGMADRISVASVATGFPSGQYLLRTRLEEIKAAVKDGATEIDVVIDRGLVLKHQWEKLYQEIQQMKEACGTVHMKTILAVGELGSLTNVYKASLVAMMAGSDFIKTSTGKEAVNATLPVGIVMCRAIRDYYQRVGYKVGFKPAGGIRTAKDALNWLVLMKEELGTPWQFPDLFRIGASGLLGDIERQLYHYVTGRYAAINEFSLG